MTVDNIWNLPPGTCRLGPSNNIRWYMPAGRPIPPQRPSRGGITLHFTVETDRGGLTVPGSDHVISYTAVSHDQSPGIQDKIAGNLLEKPAGSTL
jgi:hypothetical protein